jgi:undecaprenyl-diphosphatase
VTLLQALVLGVVQGVTEWLPVSSTAHLLLVPWLLGWWAPGAGPEGLFAFDVIVQDGTLLAVVVYFRRDLREILGGAWAAARRGSPLADPGGRIACWIVLGTIPAVAAGLALQPLVEGLHARPDVIGAVLVAATALLYLAERPGIRERAAADLGPGRALLVGIFQALALVPGVSRSAATLAGGMDAGMDRTAAARFSFLLSIPVLAAAGVLGTADWLRGPDPLRHLPALAAGFLAAAAVGYGTIHALLAVLARKPLTLFAPYRILLGIALLAWALS